MGCRRRDFDEFEDETREPPPGRSGGGWIVAATFIKYAAIVIIVLIIAYVVLRVLGVLRGALTERRFLDGPAESTTTRRTTVGVAHAEPEHGVLNEGVGVEAGSVHAHLDQPSPHLLRRSMLLSPGNEPRASGGVPVYGS